MVAMHECVSCVAIKTQVFDHNNNNIIIIPSNCIVVIMHVVNGCKYVHSLPITEMEYETIDPRPTLQLPNYKSVAAWHPECMMHASMMQG